MSRHRGSSVGRRRRLGTLAAAALAAGLLSACESTQDKSARIGQEAGSVRLDDRQAVIKRQDPRVNVLSASVLADVNGAAAVVEVRNATKRPLADVPVSIDVKGRGGRSLFRNDAAGIEPSLAAVPLLAPGKTLTWVNDQVSVAERPRSVAGRTGGGRPVGRGRVPEIELSRARLERDPVSGIAARGFVSNRSRVEQRKLVVYAVARRGVRIVAAGRGQVNRLKAGKRARFTVFFIGDPRRGRLELAAPPTRLG